MFVKEKKKCIASCMCERVCVVKERDRESVSGENESVNEREREAERKRDEGGLVTEEAHTSARAR